MKIGKLALIVVAGVGLVVGGLQLASWAGKKKANTPNKKAEVGQIAPDFQLPSNQGKRYKLSQFRGKYVVLEWLNHGCPFVKKHYRGNMQMLQRKYGKKGVVWFSVVSSAPGKQGYHSPKKAAALTKKLKASPTAVLRDPSGKVGKMYGAMTTPHMYVINPKGVLLYMGAIDSIRSVDEDDIKKAVNYVAKALDEAMVGKAVSTPKTRPYGCSVKYP